MSKLIEHLKSFNRKERSILLEKALGSTTFQLSDKFRDELKECLDLDIPVYAYVAMDYHIGWIQMAIYLDCAEVSEQPIPSGEGIEGVNDNQQDVDLLVAFTENSVTHLVLVEAKADTSWDYEQLDSKVKRLKSISPDPTRLKLHFVLMSPKRPNLGRSKHICISEWPDWMKRDGDFNHMRLDLAPCLRKITRCNNDKKMTPDRDGQYYRIDPIAYLEPEG